ncbi:MAG: thiamine pyrophosphate-dependent dehydrogenase E1 component subunit alpha, partial [Candidatus Thorarchaeota archaeon]
MTDLLQSMDRDDLVGILEKMYLIRLFEEKTAELVESRDIITPAHLYIGQEAVAAGICAALEDEDYVFSNHRGHGHYLAKGGDPQKLMSELLCREDGCSKGRGGSMHIVAPEVGVLGTSSIVGGCIPIGAGAALGIKLRNSNQVSTAFFGDGAADEGVFFESLNFAAIYDLPVLFVVENNHYASHLHI